MGVPAPADRALSSIIEHLPVGESAPQRGRQGRHVIRQRGQMPSQPPAASGQHLPPVIGRSGPQPRMNPHRGPHVGEPRNAPYDQSQRRALSCRRRAVPATTAIGTASPLLPRIASSRARGQFWLPRDQRRARRQLLRHRPSRTLARLARDPAGCDGRPPLRRTRAGTTRPSRAHRVQGGGDSATTRSIARARSSDSRHGTAGLRVIPNRLAHPRLYPPVTAELGDSPGQGGSEALRSPLPHQMPSPLAQHLLSVRRRTS